MSDHPNAISLEKGDKLTDQSHEIMRVWITNGAGSSVWIDAGALQDPYIFGYLMADTVRHAARAYATTWSIDAPDGPRPVKFVPVINPLIELVCPLPWPLEAALSTPLRMWKSRR